MTFPIGFNRKLDVRVYFAHFQYLIGTFLSLIDNERLKRVQ